MASRPRARKSKSKPAPAPVAFRPGYILLDESTASGGVSYARHLIADDTINGGAGRETRHETVKVVDVVDVVEAIDKLVKRVDQVFRRHATKLGRNWFVAAEGLATVEGEIADLAAEMARLNEAAEAAGSDRRGRVAILPLWVDFDRAECAREIQRTVHDGLAAIAAALRAGEVGKFHGLKIKTLNLDAFAVGFQADSVRWALERFAEAAKEIKAAGTEAGKAAEAAGAKRPEIEAAVAAAEVAAGAAVDIEAIEAAITIFAPQGAA